MAKLYALGELLIDFQSVGTGGLKDTETFVKKAGGAPANVCAQAGKLGAKTAYLTKVGDDGFGEFLIESLRDIGVDVTHVLKDKKHLTSLAFVSLAESGEREFSFYRHDAADLCLTPEEFDDVAFEPGDILEFGSVALASESARQTHRHLIQKAKQAGATIAFDPNLRFNLWEDHELLRDTVRSFAEYADIMKVGKDELEFLFGPLDDQTLSALFTGTLKVLLVTDGGAGAKLYLKDRQYHCPGYKVETIDTTGAGDSFFGAMLGQVLLLGLSKRDLENGSAPYAEMLQFACKAGAYTTTGYGAIPSMGNREQIERKVQ